MSVYEYQQDIAMLKGIAAQAKETADALQRVVDLLVKIRKEKV